MNTQLFQRPQSGNPARVSGPVPHLSAGRHLVPQRYVVGWPDGVVKVGSTHFGQRRWGTFLARGGALLDLAYYEEVGQALAGEQWLQERLARTYRRAFNDRSQAVARLGSNGAGWMECYSIPVFHWPQIRELARAE